MNFTILGNPVHEVAFEFIVIWACIYLGFRFLQGTRGGGVIKGLLVLLAPLLLLQTLADDSGAFDRLNYFAETFSTYVVLLLVIIFQPELRQAAVRVGQWGPFRFMRHSSASGSTTISAIADAATFLSRSQFGALMAIERENETADHVIGGQELDAEVSAPLIESIFWPNNPLHDLGVVIRGDRVRRASVQFPLADEGSLPVELGSRHRAAVGLSMRCDALVIIVSEQTGQVSLADQGVLAPVDRDDLEGELIRRLEQTPLDPPATGDDEQPVVEEPEATTAVAEQTP